MLKKVDVEAEVIVVDNWMHDGACTLVRLGICEAVVAVFALWPALGSFGEEIDEDVIAVVVNAPEVEVKANGAVVLLLPKVVDPPSLDVVLSGERPSTPYPEKNRT